VIKDATASGDQSVKRQPVEFPDPHQQRDHYRPPPGYGVTSMIGVLCYKSGAIE
jgi:hypothetical protein